MTKLRKIVFFNTDGNDLSVEENTLEQAGYDNYSLVRLAGDNDEAFLKEAIDADAVVVTYADLSRDKLARLKKLKIVAKPTIGFDNVDLEAATDQQVYVTNAPKYCIEEVANATLMLMMAARGRLRMLDKASREGRDVLATGTFSEGAIHRLSHQVYGLVSFGHIARTVAKQMKGLKIGRIVAYDPYAPDSLFEEAGVERVEHLDDLLQAADIISLHAPLTPQTYHMISEREFKLMKKNVCLVNTGRGGLIDEIAAAEALNMGQIGSLATDVLEDEINFTSPLTEIDSVFITPHTAFYSEESTEEARITPILEIISVLERSEQPKYMVNKNWE
jgi:D-3-phosphoglycerate dehydrogenase